MEPETSAEAVQFLKNSLRSVQKEQSAVTRAFRLINRDGNKPDNDEFEKLVEKRQRLRRDAVWYQRQYNFISQLREYESK